MEILSSFIKVSCKWLGTSSQEGGHCSDRSWLKHRAGTKHLGITILLKMEKTHLRPGVFCSCSGSPQLEVSQLWRVRA